MTSRTADIVVVGMGNAAQAAAASAHDGGAQVLVVDKSPEIKRGSNSWFSSSAHFRHAHNGLADERPLVPHVPDSQFDLFDLPPYPKDTFYGDIMRVTRGKAVPELVELMVNESYPTVRWMRESGFTWEVMYPDEKVGGRFSWYPGAVFIQSKDGGAGCVEMWYQILKRKGVEVLFSTPAVRLITDDKGGVKGLIVQGQEGYEEIRCKAVILGCGGFEANPEMRAKYLGLGWDLVKVRGTHTNTGDGITMALEAGAQVLGHWSGAHASPIDADAGDVEAGFLDPLNRRHRTHRYSWLYGIMVNAEGRRFLDEGEDFSGYTYAKFGGEIQKQPGGIAYQIFDAKTLPHVLSGDMYAGATPTTANTIEELAEHLEVNVGSLATTVKEFNKAVVEDREVNYILHDGRHTERIHPPKTNWAQKIDTPPFTAFAASCGITFTYGGLKINTQCQVINRLDLPIRGLYACGEITAGFFYYNYPSGSGLMRGGVTGRIAGRNAATD